MKSPRDRRLLQFSLASLLLLLTAAAVSSGVYAWIRGHRGAVRLEGVVTMKGQPLEDCLIVLTPTTKAPKPRSYSAKPNEVGRYEFLDQEGLRSGEYAVSIQSRPGISRPAPLPARYNSQTMLMIHLQEGENRMDLELHD
jgi:hypothetical protein